MGPSNGLPRLPPAGDSFHEIETVFYRKSSPNFFILVGFIDRTDLRKSKIPCHEKKFLGTAERQRYARKD
jgi:hypothetical protein